MADDFAAGFSFQRAAAFQPIVPNPPAVVPAKQTSDHVASSVARIPSVNQGRSFIPRGDPQVSTSLQNGSAEGSGGGLSMVDSGRKGDLMGGVDGGLMNVDGEGNRDQVSLKSPIGDIS